MQIFLGLAFILIVSSIMLLFRISYNEIINFVSSLNKNTSLKKQQSKLKHKNRLKTLYDETIEMLTATGQRNKFYMVITVSTVLVAVGIFVGISMDNIFIAPILGIAFAAVPFVFVRYQFIEYKKMLTSEMETALSIITSSYERSENILLAFQENINNINEPVKGVFEKFVLTLEKTNTNPVIAIEEMKEKIKHPVFIEWCENLKRCVDNRTLKSTLRPVVNKLTDIRIATSEAKNILYSAKRECSIVLIISVIFIIINFWILPLAFKVNVNSQIKNFLFAINIAIVLISTIRMLMLTKDINYDL